MSVDTSAAVPIIAHDFEAEQLRAVDDEAPAQVASTQAAAPAAPVPVKRALSSGSSATLAATRAKWNDLFSVIDDDGNGFINLQELQNHLDALAECGVYIPPFGAVTLFSDFDLDGSGTIDVTEFCTAMAYMSNTCAEAARAGEMRLDVFRSMRAKSARLFETLDTDDSGALSIVELERHQPLLEEWGFDFGRPKRTVKQLFLEMDLDGSATIDPSEFESCFAASHAWGEEELAHANAKLWERLELGAEQAHEDPGGQGGVRLEQAQRLVMSSAGAAVAATQAAPVDPNDAGAIALAAIKAEDKRADASSTRNRMLLVAIALSVLVLYIRTQMNRSAEGGGSAAEL
jgi:Ca2+-binding EF-hand superfamily protein